MGLASACLVRVCLRPEYGVHGFAPARAKLVLLLVCLLCSLQPCPVGTYSATTTSCLQCGFGKFADGGDSSCIDCTGEMMIMPRSFSSFLRWSPIQYTVSFRSWFTAGRFGNAMGMNSSACTGPCTQNYYCIAVS